MKAVKALQEAMTRIETLETKVKTLEDAQINKGKERNNRCHIQENKQLQDKPKQ